MGHAHKASFWYLLGVFSKFSGGHLCPLSLLYGRTPPDTMTLSEDSDSEVEIRKRKMDL